MKKRLGRPETGEVFLLIKTITKKEVLRMNLRGKPKCPFCNRPLTYVYEGAKGMTGEKCKKCGQEYLVDTETLEVIRILNQAS